MKTWVKATSGRDIKSLSKPLIVEDSKFGVKKSRVKIKPIVVAVIDTGIDYSHKNLSKFLYYNKGESGLDAFGKSKKTNGLDDDGNGYIDDYRGWNFAGDDNDISDDHGHGTHVSGLISSHVSFDSAVRILPIKYYKASNSGLENLKNSLKAIEYAISLKVDIINYSSGGPIYSYAEKVLVAKAKDAGILFISAAGNEGMNNDQQGYYPANYRLPNIISVASTSIEGSLMATSNFGQMNVDVAARGDKVVSALPGNKQGEMSGTSQATAKVTAAFINFAIKRRRNSELSSLKPAFLNSLKVDQSLAPYVHEGKSL